MTTRPCRHSPFLSRTGNVLHEFFQCNFWILTFIQDIRKRDFPFFRKVSFSYPCADKRSKSANPPTSNLLPLTFLLCTVPRIRQDSCRLMSPGSYRPANLLICTDSKQSLRPLSFLSRTGTVLQAFLCANIQDSTFHQADCCGRLQTVRPPAECRLSDTKT